MIKRSKSVKRKKPSPVTSSINYTTVTIFAIIGGVIILVLMFFGRNFAGDWLNPDDSEDSTTTENDSVVEVLDTLLPSLDPTVTPTTAPTLTPSPTPEPTVNAADFRLQILNGNGRTGGATEAQNVLEAGGFSVEGVGNASRWDYEKTEIRGSSDVPVEILNQAAELFSSLYVTEVFENSDNTNDFDILVVLGRQTP